MSTLNRLRGSLTALVTPFRNGAIDEDALRALVDWQLAEGSHGLVPVGTTGESPTLSHDEHKRVVDITVQETKGRAPIIAGAGSNNTQEAIELAVHAEKSGADAVLVVAPYYNKPGAEGVYRHFAAIDAAIGIPIIIYNIPGRCGIDISIDTLKRCRDTLRNIAGLKDCSGNIARVSLQRQALGTDFIQLYGDDTPALASLALGAVGCISVASNVAPKLCAQMQETALSGDYAAALRLQDKLLPLQTALFLEPGTSGAKTALHLLGRCSEEVRLPLTSSTPATRAELQKAMAFIGLL